LRAAIRRSVLNVSLDAGSTTSIFRPFRGRRSIPDWWEKSVFFLRDGSSERSIVEGSFGGPAFVGDVSRTVTLASPDE
jgi:hypothetical protein